jgi:hypothetical protein
VLSTRTSGDRVHATRDERVPRLLGPQASIVTRVAALQRTIGNHATSQALEASLARAGTSLIVDDDRTPGVGQVRQSDFLAAVEASVTNVAGQKLATIGQDVDTCIYLGPAFRVYASESPSALEAAIERYAPGALANGDWKGVVQAVTSEVATAFEAFVKEGSFRGVPEEVRIEVHGTADEPPALERPPQQTQLSQTDGAALQRCWPFGSNTDYNRLETEMQEVNVLPEWGSAEFVGYHGTSAKAWKSIKRTGDFRPGGGLYGDGIYVVDNPWNLTAYTPEVLLEVGYVGLPTDLTHERDANRKKLPEVGSVDVLHGRIPFAQRIYWLNGPHGLVKENFRVREHRKDTV